MRIIRSIVVAAAIVSAFAAEAAAQQPAASPAAPAPLARPRVGVGFQSTWPAYGISGIYDVNEKLSAQAVLGFLGGWTTVSGRGLYRFAQQPSFEPYGYGMVGLWRYSTAVSDASAASFGGGAGVDFDIRRVGPEMPPIYLNLELGLSVVNLDLAGYTGAVMAFGAGVHYRF